MLTDIQLMARNKGIGGSDCAAICGLSKWKTPLDIYNEKIGKVKNKVENNFTHFGHILEPVILSEYSKLTGFQCISPTETITHKSYNWMIGNFDGIVSNKKIIIECKTASVYTAHLWGEEGTDQIPQEYLLQCAHYAMIYDAERVDIAVLLGGNDFRIYTYNRNEDLEKKILAMEENFWVNHVLANVPPEPQTLSDVAHLWQNSESKTCTANSDILEKAYELSRVKKQIKELEKKSDDLSFLLKAHMKENDSLEGADGEKLASWKTQSRSFFNASVFKEQQPDIYKNFLVENITRVFRLNNKLDS